MKNSVVHSFVDEKGKNSEMIISSENSQQIKLKPNYKLQRPESDNKYMRKGAKGKGVFTSEIGHKSDGFAPIFTLAFIIAISIIAVAYFMWRF